MVRTAVDLGSKTMDQEGPVFLIWCRNCAAKRICPGQMELPLKESKP